MVLQYIGCERDGFNAGTVEGKQGEDGFMDFGSVEEAAAGEDDYRFFSLIVTA